MKRLIAAFFVVMLLFINLVKLSHGHDIKQAISKETSVSTMVSSFNHCSVCDYHFAKDSHHFTSFSFVFKKEVGVSSYRIYNTPFVTSIGSTSSGRGPPSTS